MPVQVLFGTVNQVVTTELACGESEILVGNGNQLATGVSRSWLRPNGTNCLSAEFGNVHGPGWYGASVAVIADGMVCINSGDSHYNSTDNSYGYEAIT